MYNSINSNQRYDEYYVDPHDENQNWSDHTLKTLNFYDKKLTSVLKYTLRTVNYVPGKYSLERLPKGLSSFCGGNSLEKTPQK